MRNDELIPLVKAIYENVEQHWTAYEAFEELVDLEESFQLWRFRHLRTVLRVIGMKKGPAVRVVVPASCNVRWS